MCVHSFTLLLSRCGFAIASKTILTLVVLALYLRTALCGTEKVGSLSKHDVDGIENVIYKDNFAFLQSFFNYSKSLCLKHVS